MMIMKCFPVYRSDKSIETSNKQDTLYVYILQVTQVNILW